ncbi:CobW family GTP-binding protein [Alkalihalobacterium alkalinitrilicum]|uniref:CobW family GTP-binding protein n=1 Tax=Alkalihalobacterium alkalinitrilicum TaxID=427920 RepID=UPI000994BE47|nr:GTP-binding protein [Alkalihalobacterium alkalinitrilicum]
MKQTEIYILSGFLGSGKTTLLKTLLQYEKQAGRKVGVVMNEIGKVSIDSTAISKDLPLKELLDGCVCCTIIDQFEEQLRKLLEENDLDAIYIETTGAAHPLEVYDACMSPSLATKIYMRGIITLVDLTLWTKQHTLDQVVGELIWEQIKHADLLLLNKSDLISESEQASTLYTIQSINPKAFAVFTTYADINPAFVNGISLQEKEKTSKLTIDQLTLQTFVYTFQQPISHEKFEQFILTLPSSFYRIKGFVRFIESNMLYSFQYSNGQPILLPDMMDYPTTLVFIGTQLDKISLEQSLEKLVETRLNDMNDKH